MTPATRRQYAEAAARPAAAREDAWQRAVEFLFERLVGALGDRRHGADHASEGAAGPLPLRLGRRAALDPRRRCASTWPSTSPSCRRRERPGPARLRTAARGYCLDVAAGEQVVVRSSTLAAPLLLALQRELLEREAWPLLRVELPGQARGLVGGGARRPPRRLRARGAARGARAPQASLVIQAPDEHPRARRRRPRTASRAPPAPAGRCARRRCAGAGASRSWPTPAAAQQAGMGTDGVRRASSAARCSSTSTTPSRPGRRSAPARRALIERLAGAREIRIEADGTDLRLRVDGPHLGQLRRPAQHALRRGLHRPARGLARGHAALRLPSSPARRDGGRRGAACSAPARGRRAGRASARSTSWRRSTPTGRAAARRAGHRHEPGHRPAGRARSCFDEKIGGTVHLALGRSYPETGGDERERRALGPDLRPAAGRPADRRRRDDHGERPVRGSRAGAPPGQDRCGGRSPRLGDTRRVENAEIADRLEALASLLELADANPYTVRAYRRAADTIRSTPAAVADSSGRVAFARCAGIGPGIEARLRELVETGGIAELAELERELATRSRRPRPVPRAGREALRRARARARRPYRRRAARGRGCRPAARRAGHRLEDGGAAASGAGARRRAAGAAGHAPAPRVGARRRDRRRAGWGAGGRCAPMA